jgi:hypothetical protein
MLQALPLAIAAEIQTLVNSTVLDFSLPGQRDKVVGGKAPHSPCQRQGKPEAESFTWRNAIDERCNDRILTQGITDVRSTCNT